MSETSNSQSVEESFVEFKLKSSKAQWNDPKHLRRCALQLKVKDLPLAYRLIQRAKVLKNDGPEINRIYNNLLQRMRQEHPDLLEPLISQQTEQEEADNTKVVPITHSSSNDLPKTEEAVAPVSLSLINIAKMPIMGFVVLPWLIFAFYLLFIAAPRYESQMQLLIQQPDATATMDASMAILSGLGVSKTGSDPQLVRAYIYSFDMLQYLEQNLGLKQHYANAGLDWINGLPSDASREELLSFYKKQVQVEIDDASQVVTVFVRAFDPDFGLSLAQMIADRAEWYINSIGHYLATEQLKFIQGEHEHIEKRLQEAKTKLLNFQQQHNLLDPSAEGMALSQIAYSIEGQIATANAELRALRASMSEKAPQVLMAQAKLKALQEQLEIERLRLTEQKVSSSTENVAGDKDLSVSQLLARYTDYKVDLELALTAYTSSQVSLEKSRIEAYRQLKYLIRVESPILPQENKYPKVTYNLVLAAVLLLMLFGLGKIVVATVKELN